MTVLPQLPPRPSAATVRARGGRDSIVSAVVALAANVGGCVSIALAIDDLTSGRGLEQPPVAGIVLAVAALADGTSLWRTLRQARRDAHGWGLSTLGYRSPQRASSSRRSAGRPPPTGSPR